jgi:predicted DNA-binding transcriptional regulator AlpA
LSPKNPSPQIELSRKAAELKTDSANKASLLPALVGANNKYHVDQGLADEPTRDQHDREHMHGGRAPPGLRLLDKQAVLAITGVSFPTIWSWMRAKPPKFPRSRVMQGKSVWRSDEVEAWIEALPVRVLKGDAVDITYQNKTEVVA